MTETLLLDRYRKADELAPRFGGAAILAEDLERQGQLVEVHRLPATAALEAAYAPVRQAIDALQAVPAGPLARPLDVSWGPDGELVVVVEYQEGRRLSDVLAAERLAPRRAREVLRGALHALVLARRAGLFHGALTPARILLGQDDRVALLDVGLGALPRPAPAPEQESYEAAYRAPGDARGARGDAYAIAVLALELATGQRVTPGSKAAPEVAPDVSQTFGPEFVRAAQALVRLDGSARAFDAGALLGLLAASQKKTRRGRFTLRESWDGDIGGGTARLLQLALRPEFRDRMPEEIRGQRAAVEDEPGAPEVKFVEPLPSRPSARVPAAATPAAPPPPPPPAATPSVRLTATNAEPPPPRTVAPVAPPDLPKTVPIGQLSPQARTSTAASAEPDPFDFDVIAAPPPPLGAPPPIPWGPRPSAPPASLVPKTEPPPATLGPQITITPRAPGAGSHDSGALVTMPIKAQPPAEPVTPPSHLLFTPGGARAWFLIAPKDQSLDLGRERGNEVILRAFKNNAVESVDSNRISRKHLGIARRGDQVMIGDKKSTYGTALGPTRLPPEGETPLPPTFQLTLAQTSVRLDGRVLAGGAAVRLTRLDGAGHQYLVAWAGPELTIGSSEATDALHLPTDGGVVAGHARLVIDLARGAFLVGPKNGKVGVGGREVPPGQLVPLGAEPLQLGALALRARPARDDDFLAVSSLLPA